jgi:hypothetical protein
MSRKSLVVMITFGLLGLCPLLRAQEEEPSIDSMIEILRTGMQADKATIVATGMNLSDKDGAAFWPIYRQYEHERSMVDDGRVTVIREYTTKYPTLTDADAKAMAQRMFDYDSRIAALKKRYFKKFNKVVPALTVTKFFQLEHRIDLLMDMKVESALPPLTAAQPTAAAEDNELTQ